MPVERAGAFYGARWRASGGWRVCARRRAAPLYECWRRSAGGDSQRRTGQDVRQLNGIVKGISDIRRCILLEQRGTARSRLARIDRETITLQNYVDDLEALRQELRLKKLALLGHSWGGMLAMAYAARFPGNVESMTLISSGGPSLDFMAPAMDTMNMRRALMNLGGRREEGQDLFELRPMFYDQKKAEEFAARPKEGEVTSSVSGPLMLNLRDIKYDSRPGLRKLRCPALLINGRQDALPESVPLEIKALIRGSEVAFVERSGHFPWIEQPDAFFKVLRPFLQRH